jgi:hypothetical protein
MSEWSLEKILSSLHADIQHQLTAAREALSHPVSKGDASERIWLDLLQNYLPKRYQAEKAFIVDSKGLFSEQIDVLIFDRQYSPLSLTLEANSSSHQKVFTLFSKQNRQLMQVLLIMHIKKYYLFENYIVLVFQYRMLVARFQLNLLFTLLAGF